MADYLRRASNILPTGSTAVMARLISTVHKVFNMVSSGQLMMSTAQRSPARTARAGTSSAYSPRQAPGAAADPLQAVLPRRYCFVAAAHRQVHLAGVPP